MDKTPTPLSRRAVLAMLAAAPLGGCLGTGSRPAFTAQAGGAEALANSPTLQVVTTRRLAQGGVKSPFLDGSRGNLAYMRAELKAPETSLLGKVSALVEDDFSVRRVEPVQGAPARSFAESLRGRDTLLFVHGFNMTFERAAYDATALSAGIGFVGNTALYSWASKGGLLDYGYDRESALLARDPLAEVLAATLQDEFAARTHLVAHSMGTLVTLEALRTYHDRYGDKGFENIGAIVLAAPDVDADVFRAAIEKLARIRSKITVITATNDRALDISRRLAGNARVGALPREALEETGVRVLDATDFASGLIRHDAFVANADVRAAIKRVIDRA